MSKTTSRTNPAKRIKVVVTYEPVPGLVDDLRREFPQLDVRFAPSVEDQLVEIADADVYMGWIPRNVYEKANALKWIQVPGTGIDVVMGNVPELATNDIIVTNCKGSHAASMADHTLGMVVALAHKFPRIFADQQARKWDTASYHNRFVELEGSTMGILALGDIGAAVARRAHGFGMRVLAVDAQPSMKKPPFVEEIWGLDKLDALIAESDWFVVTAPITPATLGLINKDRITKMKHGSYLVVISRGGIRPRSPMHCGPDNVPGHHWTPPKSNPSPKTARSGTSTTSFFRRTYPLKRRAHSRVGRTSSRRTCADTWTASRSCTFATKKQATKTAFALSSVGTC